FGSIKGKLTQELANLQPGASEDEVKQALFTGLGGLLGDTNGSGGANPQAADVTMDDVEVHLDASKNTVTVGMRLTGAGTVAAVPLAFGLGLPALPIALKNSASLDFGVGFDFRDLRFTYTGGQSPSLQLDSSLPSNLTVKFGAQFAAGSEADARLGFLD